MGCPPDDVLARVVDDSLSASERAELLEHLDGCEHCRAIAAHLAAARAPSGPGAVTVGADVDGFQVRRELGSGAMGTVFEAWDSRLERRVALKFIRNALLDDSQLRDEARAMARLTHANVVSVYDVREWQGHTFLAMEFVAGQTLRQWLETPRTPREILEVFLQAGEGLAAANAAGILHRDFKPENVLIDAQGRVKVSDLGLARVRAGAAELAPAALGVSSSGKLVGTPAYMSPEQLRGERIDARADQFAFCATLAEALQGRRPWAATTIEALSRAIETTPPLLPGNVPPHVVKVLARGLSPSAAARFPSLEPLLAVLRSDPAARRRKVAGVGLGVAVVALAIGSAAWFTWKHTSQCEGAERALAGTWDPTRHDAVRKAFIASKPTFGAETADRVAALLDGWARDWAAQSKASCEATRLEGRQTERQFELRAQCLERRRLEVASLVSLFEKAEAPQVEKAVSAASALTPLSECADLQLLSNTVPLPADPRAREVIAQLQAQLAEVKALVDTAQTAKAVELGERVLARLPEASWKPLEAETSYWLGVALAWRGDYARANELQQKAELAAEAGRDDHLLAIARAEQVYLVGQRLTQPEKALELAERARVALEREGNPPADVGYFENALGGVTWRLGRFEESQQHYQRAAEFFERSSLKKSPYLATVYSNVGAALWERSRFKEAEAWQRRSLAVVRESLADTHPQLANTLDQLAISLGEQGLVEDAIPLQREALGIREKLLGADSTAVGISCVNLGDSLRRAKQFPEALELVRRARKIFADKLGPEHSHVGFTWHNEGAVLLDQRDGPAALAAFRQGLALREKALGPAHPEVAQSHLAIAEAARRAGQLDVALASVQRGLDIADSPKVDQPATVAKLLTLRGLVALARKDFKAAVPDLERSLAIYEKTPNAPVDTAEAQSGLARALVRLPRPDQERIGKLRDAALEVYTKERDAEQLELLRAIR